MDPKYRRRHASSVPTQKNKNDETEIALLSIRVCVGLSKYFYIAYLTSKDVRLRHAQIECDARSLIVTFFVSIFGLALAPVVNSIPACRLVIFPLYLAKGAKARNILIGPTHDPSFIVL